MDLIEQLVGLRQRGEPVALATVVASRRPASARPGDRALVLASGEMVGWIGGSCAPSSSAAGTTAATAGVVDGVSGTVAASVCSTAGAR